MTRSLGSDRWNAGGGGASLAGKLLIHSSCSTVESSWYPGANQAFITGVPIIAIWLDHQEAERSEFRKEGIKLSIHDGISSLAREWMLE